jgi:hypothetical protein
MFRPRHRLREDGERSEHEMDESRAVSWRGGERKSIAEKQKGRLEAEDDRCEMQENIEGWVDGRIEWVWNGLIEEESKRQPKQVWIQKRRKGGRGGGRGEKDKAARLFSQCPVLEIRLGSSLLLESFRLLLGAGDELDEVVDLIEKEARRRS